VSSGPGAPPVPAASEYVEDYVAQTIVYSPQQIQDTSNILQTLTKDIVNHMENILNTLNGLNLSWVGQAQQLENTYNQEWQAAVATLFGTSKDPGKGVLVQLASALATAAENYATAEFSGANAYLQFVWALITGSSSSPPPATSITNPPGGQIVTAITETYGSLRHCKMLQDVHGKHASARSLGVVSR
jgi:hypothetical protein